MLEFQKQILTEIVTEDGLLVISPGLGLFRILCSLVQIYSGGNHLVLLINTSKEQDELLQEQLIANGVPHEHLIKRIEYNTPAEKRFFLSLYKLPFCLTLTVLRV
jgi:DNA excision repair protein ERCC-4